VTVFITDMNYEPIAPYHFDLSGKAFGALAKPGLNDKLRHCGIIDLEFRRSLYYLYCSIGYSAISMHFSMMQDLYYVQAEMTMQCMNC
jgi:hypothetical protein